MIANDFEEKSMPVESEFEEFELLEVDNGDANNESPEILTLNDDQSLPLSSEMVQSMDILDACDIANVQNQEFEYKSKSNSSNDMRRKHKPDIKVEVQSRRKSARQAAKLQKSQHFEIKKEQTKSFVTKRKGDHSIAVKAIEENCDIDDMQQDCDEIAEGESDDEFPARDSDNEDWPSQETLDEFPKQLMKNGLLLYKGKELMSMICRYISLKKIN